MTNTTWNKKIMGEGWIRYWIMTSISHTLAGGGDLPIIELGIPSDLTEYNDSLMVCAPIFYSKNSAITGTARIENTEKLITVKTRNNYTASLTAEVGIMCIMDVFD